MTRNGPADRRRRAVFAGRFGLCDSNPGRSAPPAALAPAPDIPVPAVAQAAPARRQRAVFSKARLDREADIDLGRRGSSPGDRIIARGPLFEAAAPSKRVGSFTAELVNVHTKTLLTRESVTLTLADGQIEIQGSLRFGAVTRPAGVPLPVVGGTGAYAYARGTATMRAAKLGGDEGFSFALDLRVG